jgi:predicted nucleic acid-binding protein
VITAIDTSVLLDVFGADPNFGPNSAAAVQACLAGGSVIACEIVWAETSAFFPAVPDAEAVLRRLGVDFSPLDAASALAAGGQWRTYRRAGGTRERVIADFVIGAHALAYTDQLLTRDREFYRTYFKDLRVIDPGQG